MCNSCGSFDWDWTEASGRGTVASWTVSHRSFQPDRVAPYTVLLVRLAEADNLIIPGGWCGGSDAAGLAVGAPVVARYVDLPGERDDPPATLLHWTAVTGEPS